MNYWLALTYPDGTTQIVHGRFDHIKEVREVIRFLKDRGVKTRLRTDKPIKLYQWLMLI